MNRGIPKTWAWVLLGLVACRTTQDGSEYAVGAADEPGTGRALESSRSGPTSDATPVPCQSLGRSLRRVREHFEAGDGRLRLVALLDHRLDGIAAVREFLGQPAAADVQLVLIWDGAPCDDTWRAGLGGDGRVAAFVDRRGVAGRVFARGLLPTSCAREVYLVYGPEARWSELPVDEIPPRPFVWWHRMGRLASDHHVSDVGELGERLAGALTGTLLSRPACR